MEQLPKEFLCGPSVFAVEDTYQIVVPVTSPMLFWVEIDGVSYYDHTNGILRSSNPVHKVTVPMQALDAAGRYQVCFRKMIERSSYFPKTEDCVRLSFDFHPLLPGKEQVEIYHISDTHGLVEEAIAAEQQSGIHPDFLVLNGDIANDSSTVENICHIYEIAWGVTKGGYPCVYARGNHDLRGACAEKLEEYTPTHNGLTYFTFRLGDVFGVVLDCGEDKNDDHPEYGHTVCCHAFRQAETAFLKDVIQKGAYRDAGIAHRIVISHVPFAYNDPDFDGMFNIEVETYTTWCDLLRTMRPELQLSGHVHTCEIIRDHSRRDNKGQPCTVMLGGKPSALHNEEGFTGASVLLGRTAASVTFNDNLHQKDEQEIIPYA